MDPFGLVKPYEICGKCNRICHAMRFQQSFKNWTSGNDNIDKFIQDIQLSVHDDVSEVLEWIPYDRFYHIKYNSKDEFGKLYRANWIDGYISNFQSWDYIKQNWKRNYLNMFVNLKILNTPNDFTFELANKIKIKYEFYGMTQDPETKNYMMVLNNKCKKCDSLCNAIRFQHKFIDWTSGNDDIDKFIQDTQLSAHNVEEALEWIPYDRFYDIKYIAKDEFSEVYRANWIDGNIKYWDDLNQNWGRNNFDMFVNLRSLNAPNNLTLEFANKIKIEYEFYGITQDPETKNYMMVLNNKCEKCNKICNAIQSQHKFIDWTSGNNDIDKFIQDTQLSAHEDNEDIRETLEWIPYDRLYDIKYISKDEFGEVYRANWIDGYSISNFVVINVSENSSINQFYKQHNPNMFVNLKSLNTPNDLTFELANKIKIEYEFYGMTQDPETKNYMMVLNNKCKKCDSFCDTIHFQHKFIDWTSGNDDIDKFIQDTQISAHHYAKEALEWIPYDRFYGIKYIKKDDFGEVYRAIWIDGYIPNFLRWDDVNQNWKRYDRNMFVNLKSLDTPNNLTLEFINKVKISHEFYGITQDPITKNYMIVLDNICEKCNGVCNSIYFQQNFKNWTSGNNDIDKSIQVIQLSAHDNVNRALEWIPYDKLYDIKYITKDDFGKVYRANWIDGNVEYWDDLNKKLGRNNFDMFVNLRSLNAPNNFTLEFANKIKIKYEFYGITQDPETKNYMMVLNNKCKKCDSLCNAIRFQHKFIDWTSGNYDIDKFIQDTQLSAHNVDEALEWIPYDRFYDIKYISKDEFSEVYVAKWIDGKINQNWIRNNLNIFVNLKSLNTPNDLTFELANKIKIGYEFYGMTQNPETKNYMMVLNGKCKKCNKICNAIFFQHKFIGWTSGNNDIDKFIQDTQLSAHEDIREALEWIPYDRLHHINYTSKDEFGEVVYRANWIDGNISYYERDLSWDNKNKNWIRKDKNIYVILKNFDYSKNITSELMKEISVLFGITWDPETKNYMMVLNDSKCKKCNKICNSIRFQQKFTDWTSGNDDVDKFIQDTQISAHDDVKEALEWIPYDSFDDIVKNKFGKVYKANWINGKIYKWSNEYQNWMRHRSVNVILKSLNNLKHIAIELINEINMPVGITQNPETKNYIMILNNTICKKCNYACYAIHFQQNFENWTSGNDDIDKFIQDSQLSMHTNNEVFTNALEWIPYDRFFDIIYIAKGGFGKVYRANWIDGYITKWDSENQNWKRYNENMFIALKSLDNSKNVTLEFMNEIILHNKVKVDNNIIVRFYGITQDPKTKNYMMALEYAEGGSLRNYLDKEHNKFNWNKMFEYLQYIIVGLKCIHEKELIHRDLHIGNILKFKYKTAITDMGLCKPANYNELENAKKNIYGVLPYIAPEILRGGNYTKAADIYSFGIIMYEVISGLPPYHNLSHDNNLAIKICKGLRPRFNIKVPQLIVHLIKRCLDANILNRPVAKEIINILFRWQYESNNKQTIELQVQIMEAEEISNNSSNSSIISANSGLSYNTHSEAIYTSRLLNYDKLPEPKNSDDYYEQNDNIISKEYSESLQLNFSQLNINKSESCQIDISQLNINENGSSQISISQLNISDNESCQINISQLNNNENESSQINISRLNDNEDSQNSESGSKRKNYFLSQNNESESERKKIRIE